MILTFLSVLITIGLLNAIKEYIKEIWDDNGISSISSLIVILILFIILSWSSYNILDYLNFNIQFYNIFKFYILIYILITMVSFIKGKIFRG